MVSGEYAVNKMAYHKNCVWVLFISYQFIFHFSFFILHL
jgi:hypothetical protein